MRNFIQWYYRRRIDEMKSSANASNRKQATLATSKSQPSTNVLRPSGATVPSSAGTAGGDGVLIVDQEERQALHETKKAIDHLKSVTGNYTQPFFFSFTLSLILYINKNVAYVHHTLGFFEFLNRAFFVGTTTHRDRIHIQISMHAHRVVIY